MNSNICFNDRFTCFKSLRQIKSSFRSLNYLQICHLLFRGLSQNIKLVNVVAAVRNVLTSINDDIGGIFPT